MVLVYGRTYTSEISLTYRVAVNVPFRKVYRSVFLCMLIPIHIINELPPERSLQLTCTGAKRSLDNLHTRTRLSVKSTQNLDSSLNRIGFQPIGGVPGCQRNAECWSSGPHASSMKRVSDCLRGNSYASPILQVIFQAGSRNKALMLRLNDNKC